MLLPIEFQHYIHSNFFLQGEPGLMGLQGIKVISWSSLHLQPNEIIKTKVTISLSFPFVCSGWTWRSWSPRFDRKPRTKGIQKITEIKEEIISEFSHFGVKQSALTCHSFSSQMFSETFSCFHGDFPPLAALITHIVIVPFGSQYWTVFKLFFRAHSQIASLKALEWTMWAKPMTLSYILKVNGIQDLIS